MTGASIGRPVFPTAPVAYDIRWGNALMRSLETSFEVLEIEGAIRGTTLNLSRLPTGGGNLNVGDVFIDPEDPSLLRIVLLNHFYPDAATITLTGYAPTTL